MEIITQRKAGQQSGSGQKLKDEALPRYKGRVRAQQDIAGCLKSDRQILRTAELEKLFQVRLFTATRAACVPAISDHARHQVRDHH